MFEQTLCYVCEAFTATEVTATARARVAAAASEAAAEAEVEQALGRCVLSE